MDDQLRKVLSASIPSSVLLLMTRIVSYSLDEYRNLIKSVESGQ